MALLQPLLLTGVHSKNEEFAALMKAAGWTQAETARRLHLSPAAVSQFVNDHAVPGPTTLSLLKLLVARERDVSGNRGQETGGKSPEPGGGRPETGVRGPEVFAGLPDWASDLVSDLEELPEADREALVSAFRQIARRWRRG